jgi:hypothetical protein
MDWNDYKMRQILKLVFMLFIRIFALAVFTASIPEHDTYYVAMAIWIWLMGNTIEDSWGLKVWVK